MRMALATVSLLTIFEVIFKVKRSYFKVKCPKFANFWLFLGVKDLEGLER